MWIMHSVPPHDRLIVKTNSRKSGRSTCHHLHYYWIALNFYSNVVGDWNIDCQDSRGCGISGAGEMQCDPWWGTWLGILLILSQYFHCWSTQKWWLDISACACMDSIVCWSCFYSYLSLFHSIRIKQMKKVWWQLYKVYLCY